MFSLLLCVFYLLLFNSNSFTKDSCHYSQSRGIILESIDSNITILLPLIHLCSASTYYFLTLPVRSFSLEMCLQGLCAVTYWHTVDLLVLSGELGAYGKMKVFLAVN